MQRAELTIKGKVQNVGYRQFARIQAQKYKITGFVKNMPDNTVKIVAEGDKDNLSLFIRECRRGSFMSRIDDVQVAMGEAKGEFDTFLVEF
jgi:acylphosphatase